MLKQLQEQRNKLMTDAAAILRSENPTAEQRESAKKMLDEADVVETRIADEKRLQKFEEEQRQFKPSPRPTPGAGPNESEEERKKNFSEAIRSYARGGEAALKPEQRDLLTIGNAGALIPQMFHPTLYEAQKYVGPIAQKVTQKITNMNGAPLKISTADDRSNGLLLLGGASAPHEGVAVTEADPSFNNGILGVDTVHGGLVKVSFQELDDSAFNLDEWLRKAFGLRYARGMEKAVTVGTDSAGNTLPNFQNSLTGMATVADTTASVAAGIKWSDFTTTFGVLDPAYETNAVWVMNSTTRAYLISLEDNYGRPFFVPDPSGMKPFSMIMGKDIVIDQAMPNMGANAVPILFGDLEQSFMLRTDGDPSILRLNERYADTLEVGFYLYTRIGGISISAGATALVGIKQAAS